MELWIRSQDRIAMSKFDLLIVEETPTGEYMFIADHYKNFGTYKTRKRALEVLDEIQNILQPKYMLNSKTIKPNGDYWEENGVIFQNYTADARIEQFTTYVYEMPEE